MLSVLVVLPCPYLSTYLALFFLVSLSVLVLSYCQVSKYKCVAETDEKE